MKSSISIFDTHCESPLDTIQVSYLVSRLELRFWYSYFENNIWAVS